MDARTTAGLETDDPPGAIHWLSDLPVMEVVQTGIAAARGLQSLPARHELIQSFFAGRRLGHGSALLQESLVCSPRVSVNAGSSSFQMRLPCPMKGGVLISLTVEL